MKKFLIFVIIFSVLTQAAVFNRINTVINTPRSAAGQVGAIELGFAFAPYSSGSNPDWESDFHLNYHWNDFFIAGITRLNNYEYVANLQLIMAKHIFEQDLSIAIGIDNITATERPSTFDGIREDYPNSMTIYTVATYRENQFEFSGGFGNGRLSNSYANYDVLRKHFFYSIAYYFSKDGLSTGRVIVEYDTRNYNIGLIVPLSKQLTLRLAATQLPSESGNNLAYGANIPFQSASIGLEFETDFFSFYNDEYSEFSKKLKTLENQTAFIGERYTNALNQAEESRALLDQIRMEKQASSMEMKRLISELRAEKLNLQNEITNLRKVIQSQGFKNIQTLKKDLMDHYYSALLLYYDGKYFEAIEELTKAKIINSQIPEIHIRLGSIYWTLGFTEEALASWQEAYMLDKHNIEFNEFLKQNHISFEKAAESQDEEETPTENNQTAP